MKFPTADTIELQLQDEIFPKEKDDFPKLKPDCVGSK